MELDNQAANTEPGEVAEPVGNAEPATDTTVEPIAPEPEPAATTKPKSDGTTKAFSDRLNAKQKEWEQAHAQEIAHAKELERIAKRLGHPSVEAYLKVQDRAFLEEEARTRGIDPEVLERMNANEREAQAAKAKATELETRVNQYERREALTKLADEYPAKNPKWADFFNANRGDIMALANAMTGDGLTVDEHMDAAMLQVFKDKWEPPQPVDEEAIKKRGVEEYKAALKKQPPAEGRGGGIPNAPPKTTGDPFKDAYLKSREIMGGAHQ
jgi:hypothetical protein